jgi:hypothetical protein
MKILDYELKVLNADTIIKLDKILRLFDHGEVIIIKHDKKLVFDAKIRDRIFEIKLDNST